MPRDDMAEVIEPESSRKEIAPTPSQKVALGLPQVGFYFSAAYLLFLCALAITAWDKLFAMDPNEFGDLMAGVFAPLAFLWLVLGFFQQGEELKASVRALELQGEELRNSVEQQRELVEVTRAQMNFEIDSLEEKKFTEERRAQPVLIPIAPNHSWLDGSVRVVIGLRNAGPTATNAILIVDDHSAVEMPSLGTGDRIAYTYGAGPEDSLKPFTGYIEYIDGLGQRRARRFGYQVRRSGMGQRLILHRGSVENTLYKPPFPWEASVEDSTSDQLE